MLSKSEFYGLVKEVLNTPETDFTNQNEDFLKTKMNIALKRVTNQLSLDDQIELTKTIDFDNRDK